MSVEHLSVCRLSVVGRSDLSVGWWSAAGGRWPVGVRWFCNTPVFKLLIIKFDSISYM